MECNPNRFLFFKHLIINCLQNGLIDMLGWRRVVYCDKFYIRLVAIACADKKIEVGKYCIYSL